jgi:hypothetical protein
VGRRTIGTAILLLYQIQATSRRPEGRWVGRWRPQYCCCIKYKQQAGGQKDDDGHGKTVQVENLKLFVCLYVCLLFPRDSSGRFKLFVKFLCEYVKSYNILSLMQSIWQEYQNYIPWNAIFMSTLELGTNANDKKWEMKKIEN